MKIKFARQAPYALTIKEASLVRGLFFTVTLECEAPLNPQTGMSVDLQNAEASLAVVCASKARDQFAIGSELTQMWTNFKVHLPSDHQLRVLNLLEARGWGASYDGARIIYSRTFHAEIDGRVYRGTAYSANIDVWEKRLFMGSIHTAEAFMVQNSLEGLDLEECGTERIFHWQV